MSEALVRLHAALTAHPLRWLIVAAVPWLALAAWGATTGAAAVVVYVAAGAVFLVWMGGVLTGIYLLVLGLAGGVVAFVAWRQGSCGGLSGAGQAAAVGGMALLSLLVGGALVGGRAPVEEEAVPETIVATTMTTLEVREPTTTLLTTTTTLPSPEIDSITDGDTFRVLIDEESVPVRIIGIDAPERGDCLADEATGRLTELLASEFQLRRDVSDRDGFGRLLRHVDTAEGSAAEILVREGLAIARRYPPDVASADRLEEYHLEAQAATAGIWNWFTCGAPAPEVWAEGDQLMVRNAGTGTLSLGGLTVSDGGAASLYTFPPTVALLPSEEITVAAGCGTNRGRMLYACLGAWPALVTMEFGEEQAVAEFSQVSTTPTTSVPAVIAPAVEVSALRLDADGNDNQNKNDEWVEVTNRGPGAVDLTGWFVEDENANHTFRFPSGFELDEAATVRIRSGCGTSTATELFWCNSGSAVWNNDGDTASLFNAAGVLVDSL